MIIGFFESIGTIILVSLITSIIAAIIISTIINIYAQNKNIDENTVEENKNI